MCTSEFVLRAQLAADVEAVARLEARAFGPGRFARTAYRLREQGAHDGTFCLVAEEESKIVGSVQFSPVVIGNKTGAVLLGPLVVDPDCLGGGVGSALMRAGIEKAKMRGFKLILLVGDLSFYGRFGFGQSAPGQIHLPGPVDGRRLLLLALNEGANEEFSGLVDAAG